MTAVKICGITEEKALQVLVANGADFAGFVFHSASPRYVSLEKAETLIAFLPPAVVAVGLFVNPSDEDLFAAINRLPLKMIQLHGDETAARVKQIKDTFAVPLMKAIRINSIDDLAQVSAYEKVADWLLFDTKIAPNPPALSLSKRGERIQSPEMEYGGTGHSFDWTILKDRTFKKPWMLAGGLNIQNVAEALNTLSPDALDVSSGVESTRGVKDPAKIESLLKKVRNIDKSLKKP